MPSSHPDVIKVGTSRYRVRRTWDGGYTADGITCRTRDGLETELSRRAEKRKIARGKEDAKTGDPYPDSPGLLGFLFGSAKEPAEKKSAWDLW